MPTRYASPGSRLAIDSMLAEDARRSTPADRSPLERPGIGPPSSRRHPGAGPDQAAQGDAVDDVGRDDLQPLEWPRPSARAPRAHRGPGESLGPGVQSGQGPGREDPARDIRPPRAWRRGKSRPPTASAAPARWPGPRRVIIARRASARSRARPGSARRGRRLGRPDVQQRREVLHGAGVRDSRPSRRSTRTTCRPSSDATRRARASDPPDAIAIRPGGEREPQAVGQPPEQLRGRPTAPGPARPSARALRLLDAPARTTVVLPSPGLGEQG